MRRRLSTTGLCAALALGLCAPALADEDQREHWRYGDSRVPPECLEESPVVGRSNCANFGSWALPPDLPRMQLSLGLSARILGAHELELTDSAGLDTAARRTGESASQDGGPGGEAITFDYRVTGELSRHLYTGFDVSVGRVHLDMADPQAPGEDLRGKGMYYAAGGLLGLVAVGDPITLRAEMGAGARFAAISIESEDFGRSSHVTRAQWVLEPRVAAELWLSPWVTLGARAGTDLLRKRDIFFGMYVSFYGRAYDGSKGR